jgi:alanine dehydrogenase
MSIAITPFTKQQLLPQEENLRWAEKAIFYWYSKGNQLPRTPYVSSDAVNSLSFNGHRVMIESGAGESSSYSDKEYSDAGGVTKDTTKSIWLSMILKVGPPTLLRLQ